MPKLITDLEGAVIPPVIPMHRDAPRAPAMPVATAITTPAGIMLNIYGGTTALELFAAGIAGHLAAAQTRNAGDGAFTVADVDAIAFQSVQIAARVIEQARHVLAKIEQDMQPAKEEGHATLD